MLSDPARITRDSYIVAGVHVFLALFYWLVLGVSVVHDFGPDTWGWFSQNLPTDLLLDRALESIWFLHTQPPLWNTLGAVLVQTFGSLHMVMLQCLHIGLGAGICVMGLGITARATGSRRLALTVGLVLALHPALFLLEAYALYTTACAFLIMLAAQLLARSKEDNTRWAMVAFICVISVLTMTRSVYHALLPLLFGITFWGTLKGVTRRQVIVLSLALLAPLGWYGKNQLQHGFFGTSSWYGIGLWRVALFNQDQDLLDELYEGGELHDVVTFPPFTPPSAYRRIGFDNVSSVESLSRDDFQNVNQPAISEAYRSSAIVLIRHTPRQYFRNIFTAYGNFSDPTSRFSHLAANRDRIRWHASLEQWLLLRPLAARIEAKLGRGYFGSIYFLLFPAFLLLYAWQFIGRTKGIRQASETILDDRVLFFITAIVGYTIIVTSAMELGENVRFKFMIEPAFLTSVAIMAHRRWRKDPARVAPEAIPE